MLFNNFSAFLERWLMPVAEVISRQPHLMSVRNGMVYSLPFTIVGSFFLVLASPPVDPDTLNQGAFYAPFLMAWYNFSQDYHQYLIVPYTMTMKILSIFVVLGISYSMAGYKKLHPFTSAINALASFFIVTAGFSDTNLSTEYFGGQGLVTAIMVGLISIELTAFFIRRNITLKLPNGVPEAIAESFNALIPLTVNVLLWWGLTITSVVAFDKSLPALIFSFVSPALSGVDNGFFMTLAFGLGQLFWFLGIHDTATVWPILDPLGQSNILLNAQNYATGQPLTGVLTDQFWGSYIAIGGSGSTLVFVFMLAMSKAKHLKQIGRLGLIPSLFNINEPVIFGLPIFLNPILFVPFVLAPMVNTALAYTAINFDLIGHSFVSIPWSTPSFLSGPLSTLDYRAGILVAFLMILDAFIYYPFFKILEKQQIKQESATE
ncbi:PTS sugar transporter subunit IIC [Pectobacterium parmentieri]|uniref:Permease IIC component n=1 Tax=Pectobacterium parmentieri TaxID=1905730 RepID=A0A0H3I9W0_PECPM|nr:PTS transporter subunit EIIC [Pectobacterium parmentieri]ACX89258.1 PTS system, lactose/cellobiose family IIC subunit [Pectobacterium parmentieri WPP163]AFI91726.1 PTS system, cellobiose-specific IIC component [Pectobacterium parmentieri]AOR57494.1 hypothetical protein A8F97_00990 [Pectobacterium parmentieri]AYH06942.1 PTS sugar transporter subunit IIC [Pectobacterium parmentieri]AYH11467.1 PTS sugar transporter subunit IIC [Pectobacterium parmentieri]